MRRVVVRCAAVALLLTALPLAAQTGVWTAVGSTGAIDEASLPIYAFNTNNLTFLGAATGTVVARYNVTNTLGGGFTDVPPWTTLEMTYFDIAASSSVSATLYQVNRCTNTFTVICGVASVDATSPTCVACTFPAGSINFANSAYVVEVRLTRTANPLPQLFSLRIF
ncbi:MAG TPA: hypothetical protein VH394_30345 [Thermoanaerobaculia bacterium]|jgi:hypothetical protein|nr:hypothetical protein [Thermoanaerobaculia bacterium]